jgi:intein/homing endonuclease
MKIYVWAMGTDIIYKRGLFGALNNCAFTSTDRIDKDPITPFTFMTDASMQGVGVGFDVRGAGKLKVNAPPEFTLNMTYFVIPDTREGWVEAIEYLLDAYLNNSKHDSPHFGKLEPTFVYSEIRKAGVKLKTFGGTSSGYKPLEEAIESIRKVLRSHDGKTLSERGITDIMNMIGKCVVAGGIRRCLHEDTLIPTNNRGLQKIKNINIGDKLTTIGGEVTVTDHLYQGKQQITLIETDVGNIKCTSDHRIAVRNPNSDKNIDGFGKDAFIWKMAKDLNEDDEIMYQSYGGNLVEFYNEVDSQLPPFYYEKSINTTVIQDITIPKLDEGVAWLFGLIHGDGYIFLNDTHGRVSIAVHNDQKEIALQAMKELQKFGVKVYINEVKNENRLNVIVHSRQLASYMIQFKQPNISINIPDFIWDGNYEIKSAYIAGLFDADGTVKSRPTSIASIYYNYLEQIQTLLHMITIPTQIKLRRKANGNWKTLYNLNFTGKVARKGFNEKILPYSIKATEQSEIRPYYNAQFGKSNWEGYTFSVRIRNIIVTNEFAETYDISINDEELVSFVLANGLLVHNTAQIAFGNGDEFIQLKDYELHPERQAHGWASNNTVIKTINDGFSDVEKYMRKNGEPGIMFLDNMQNFGRMGVNSSEMFGVDHKVTGSNPCLEQSLEHMEMCCLVETFPLKCDTFDEYKDVLKYAYLYAKTVTLGTTGWEATDEVMQRNRRIGTSVSGVRQFIAQRGLDILKQWLNDGYNIVGNWDGIYSQWLEIPKSIKTTSVKPSGTVSLLAGASPGIHHNPAGSRFYKRRVTINNNNGAMKIAIDKGYEIEPKLNYKDGEWVDSDTESIITFYCDSGVDENESSMYDQLELAAFMQEWWADNQVSLTVTFDPDTEGGQIAEALDEFKYQIKGASFMPKVSVTNSGYKQLPYEPVTKYEYDYGLNEVKYRNKKSNFIIEDQTILDKIFENYKEDDAEMELFCSNDTCEI